MLACDLLAPFQKIKHIFENSNPKKSEVKKDVSARGYKQHEHKRRICLCRIGLDIVLIGEQFKVGAGT